MKNIKYAFDMFIRNPFLIVITIIQISSVIVFVSITSSITSLASDTSKKVSAIFEEHKFYGIQDKSNEEILFNHTFKKPDAVNRMEVFYNYLINNDEFTFIEYIPSVEEVKGRINLEDFNETQDGLFVVIEGKEFTSLKAINVGKNFFDILPFRLYKGEFGEDWVQDLPKDRSCILGYEYKDIFDIGAELQIYNWEKESIEKVIISGFLERDSFFLDSGQGLINLDSYMILPIKKVDISAEHAIPGFDHRISQSFIITEQPEEVFDLIQSKSNELNLYTSLKPYDMGEHGGALVSAFKRVIKNIMPISIAIFIFSTISLITSLLSIIKKGEKEFGVHLLSGATLHDIALRIFYIIVFYIGISSILALPINSIFKKLVFAEFVFPGTWHILIPFILMLVLLISIIPVITILTTNVNEIIRRKE